MEWGGGCNSTPPHASVLSNAIIVLLYPSGFFKNPRPFVFVAVEPILHGLVHHLINSLCGVLLLFFFLTRALWLYFFFLKSEIMIQFFQFSPNREKRRTRPSNTVAISGLRHSWDLDPQVGFITSRRRFIINGAAMRFFLFSRNWKRFIFLHQTTCVVDQGGLIKKNNGTENNSNTLIAC